MPDFRAILMFLFGIVLIVGRKKTANQLFKHYSPMLGQNRRFLPILSTLTVIIALAFIAFGFFLTSFNEKNPDYIFGGYFITSIIALTGITYLTWSIPGYYRWKKTKKSIELALFIAKLSIGILILIGVIANAITTRF